METCIEVVGIVPMIKKKKMIKIIKNNNNKKKKNEKLVGILVVI